MTQQQNSSLQNLQLLNTALYKILPLWTHFFYLPKSSPLVVLLPLLLIQKLSRERLQADLCLPTLCIYSTFAGQASLPTNRFCERRKRCTGAEEKTKSFKILYIPEGKITASTTLDNPVGLFLSSGNSKWGVMFLFSKSGDRDGHSGLASSSLLQLTGLNSWRPVTAKRVWQYLCLGPMVRNNSPFTHLSQRSFIA